MYLYQLKYHLEFHDVCALYMKDLCTITITDVGHFTAPFEICDIMKVDFRFQSVDYIT